MNRGQGVFALVQAAILAAASSTTMLAQIRWNVPPQEPGNRLAYGSAAVRSSDTLSFYKRKAEWKRVIDDYWGPGLPLDQKLQVFNTFADFVQSKFSAFNGLAVNWDSLRSHYRNQITDSTSHGRFSGIMSALAYRLGEAHTVIFDNNYFRVNLTTNRPIYPAWGTPVLAMIGADGNPLGATVSPLPDSSLLVIRTIPAHPLGLRVGDVVLGYEGVPWKNLWRELLAAEMPLFLPSGGSPSSVEHLWLTAGGVNWHLFDTVDVVKYPTGDTVHLPLDTLRTLDISGVLCYRQALEVPGVPEPDYMQMYYLNTRPVTYGTVQGTNIGCVIVTSHVNPATRDQFKNAVDAFWNTDGMIIDIRHDFGGETLYHLGQGLARMTNVRTYTFDIFRRASPFDVFSLARFSPPSGSAGGHDLYIDADPETLYDRPVAVLVGPHCVSMGDVSAHMLKLLPNARFFGKSPRGCMASHWDDEMLPDILGFDLNVSDMILLDYHEPSRMLQRAEFPVDEQVWLTQADVVRGDDSVVKRALAWIRSVAHTHQVAVSTRYARPGVDTVWLTAHLKNPGSHPVSVVARYVADSTAVDSTLFADDGQHGDGAAGDGVWGSSWEVPAGEWFYGVSTRVVDPMDPTTYGMPYAARFTTAGPLTCAGYTITSPDTMPNAGDLLKLAVRVKNNGSTLSIPGVTAKATSLHAGNIVSVAPLAFGTIAPGSVAVSSVTLQLRLSTAIPGPYTARIVLELLSEGFQYWRDTLAVSVLPIQGAFVVMDTRPVQLPPLPRSDTSFDTSFSVQNIGTAADSLFISVDPGNVVPDTALTAFPERFALAGGDSQKVTFRVRPALLGKAYYAAQVIVEPRSGMGQAQFKKDFLFQVVETGVSDIDCMPTEFSLLQNFPNPFNPSTVVGFQLPAACRVRLAVYDLLGREVAVLVDENKAPGSYEVTYDAGRLPSGVYFYRITAGSFLAVRRMLLMR